jgi:hypothetical protein
MSDSGSWERVGAAKNGKAKNGVGGNKTKDADRAKMTVNAVKLEDVCKYKHEEVCALHCR